MPFQINWTEPANENVRKVIAYLKKVEPSAVEIVVDQILGTVKRLADSPFQGEIYKKLNGAEIRETIAGSYRVFFSIYETEKKIDVLKVWHTSRDEPDFDD